MTEHGQVGFFSEQEKLQLIELSKEIFEAAVVLTKKHMSTQDYEKALKCAQISQIMGITLLGFGGQHGNR